MLCSVNLITCLSFSVSEEAFCVPVARMGCMGAKPVVHPDPGSGWILEDAAVMGRSLPEGCAEPVGQLPVDPLQEPGAPAAPTATTAVSTTGSTAHYPGLLGQLAAVRVLVVPQLTTLASCGWLFRLLTALRIRDEQPSRSGPNMGRLRCDCEARPKSPTSVACNIISTHRCPWINPSWISRGRQAAGGRTSQPRVCRRSPRPPPSWTRP